MNRFTVYKITNCINGKVYIGATKKAINKRWTQHKCNYTIKTQPLYIDMVKYGIENFTIEIIKECLSEIDMYSMEINLIIKHNSNNNLYGYNNSCGGKISSKGTKRTPEQRKRISEYQKSRVRNPCSQETINKMRIAAKGRDMTKAVMASSKKRKGMPAYNRSQVYSVDNFGVCNYYDSITDASKKTKIGMTSIANNLSKLSKKAGGLIWYYQHEN